MESGSNARTDDSRRRDFIFFFFFFFVFVARLSSFSCLAVIVFFRFGVSRFLGGTPLSFRAGYFFFFFFVLPIVRIW